MLTVASMPANKQLSRFSLSLLLTIGMFVIFVIVFAFYVRAEKRIDHANELRYRSYVLADVLRQSSDDLTRMVRYYVATGDAIYKRHYQEILDIRDGRRPRPVGYEGVYWDLVLDDDRRPLPDGEAVSLLELMRQAGFTEEEFSRLAQAKAKSDALTRTEFAAMSLIESTKPTTQANRLKATLMLNDSFYHRAKADIMRPISEFYRMVDRRTLEAVKDAESAAALVQAMLIVFGAILMLALWNAYRALYSTLGCSVDELQGRIARMGSGDFSSLMQTPKGMENSILAWLSETQINLARIEAERMEARAELSRLNSELERRVAERTAELETALYDLENFTYSASHDLRIPLRAIDGFSRILQDEYSQKLDGEGMRQLNVVRDNARKMAQYIDDMLAFSRAGHMAMTPARIDTEELVRAVWEELKPVRADREVKFEMDKLPSLFADPVMMRQVFVNLLSNAIKFSRNKKMASILVGGSMEGEEAVCYVRDNGAGFDMQYANKLFGVFQRLHTVSEFEGNGIGLAIVKRIINRHGGRVWAEGKVDVGATVYFALPKKETGNG